jgi:uncharacterized protein (TIGR02271 family)
MENTVIGVYDSYAQAQNARNDLLAAGFSESDVQLSQESEITDTGATTRAGTGHEGGIGHFFRSLFGMEDEREHHDVYSEAVRRGSCVLTAYADSDEARDRAGEIMNRYDPVDIDERATHWKSQGWTGYDEAAPRYTESEAEKERGMYAQARTGTNSREQETGIPVVEEELKVGKRMVQRGGVRVYQHTSEKPVHDSLQLREEHVNVERHPVDQPATEADMAAFKEGSVEMREMAEEPVVSKTARVVEEVVVGKDVSEETANIDNTVRRTDVEVEQLDAGNARRNADYADTTAMASDSDYRTHWQNAYGKSGGRYEEYDAAYRYGSTMAGSDRFKNYRWEDAEPQMRSDWESTHPESKWDKVKDAVRYGAERVSGGQQRR